MSTLITILHIIVSLFLVLTILLQQGKSGGMGGAFGGSNAGTVFGGSGASTFLRKMTAVAAVIFMSTSIILAFIASHDSSDALEKFGRSQADLAQKKEEAKEKALQDGAGSGSAAGSAAPSSMGVPTPPATGSAGSAGSATETGSAGSATEAGSAGSASEVPVRPASTGSTASPARPAATGSGTAAGNASVIDPKRDSGSGISMPNTPGRQQPPAPKANTTVKTEAKTASPVTAPAGNDTTKSADAKGSAAPAESSPNAPK